MRDYRHLKSAALAGVSVIALTSAAVAENFNIPAGTLENALNAYSQQSGRQLLYPNALVKGVRTRGAAGDMTAEVALSRILTGTGLSTRDEADATVIVREPGKTSATVPVIRLAETSTVHAAASVETVVVTSSKIKGDIQTVPIAITALSQEQLTSRQIAGGPDLVKEVPNLTFSKTNFTGYNIEIRGIGTQAISVTTDPAVAVAFNDTPFIRNHFFEQEFYDVSQVEVLRGPQGTLYGRNATAGVVNVISAKPTDQFEAMLSADWGNYSNRRYEGMVNIPVVDDRLDLRVAGEWTKRDGYSFKSLTNAPIDGRDLWSSRVTLGWKPSAKFQAYLVWEHFQEDDDRIRSSKQLCKYDPGPATVLGVSTASGSDGQIGAEYLSQGCLPTSFYSKDAFETPNSLSLPYYGGLIGAGFGQSLANPLDGDYFDAYSSKVQSTNLRVIESALNPSYKAKNDTIELNADYAVTPALSFTSQSAFNNDFLWSTEDFNRFNTAPGIFLYDPNGFGNFGQLIQPTGQFRCDDGTIVTAASSCTNPYSARPFGNFCDPQLGCSDRLVAEDLSDEHAWQVSQEFRLASNFSGPLNFSVGANYLHYETEENYYVFINTLTMFVAKTLGATWVPGVSDNTACTSGLGSGPPTHAYPNPQSGGNVEGCLGYIDPNPIGKLNNLGHNYFLSQNPYVLNSYAGFGEAYYTVSNQLKLIGGLRWTDDQKRFFDIPSELLEDNAGYPTTAVVNQQWNEWTGRFTANWTPKLDFTEQTLVYGSYAHGYKAGGANPPGAALLTFTAGDIADPVHPLTFKPEFIDAYELGTKNTALDGALTLNGDVFYYNYKAYQISEIVDRTAINLNFDATVKGAELETTWEAVPGLKFSFAGGYEDTRIDNGQSAVDLMDRTAGNPNWLVVKPFVTQASNCILPAYVVAYEITRGSGYGIPYACGEAYNLHYDPGVMGDGGGTAPYQANPEPGYPGFDPCAGNAACPVYAQTFTGQYVNTGTIDDPYTGQNTYNGVDYGPVPNNGEGFAKNVGGNELPNAPHFTTSLSADWTLPVSEDWAATLHSDFYWQSQSFARVFNDRPYDKLRGYSNVNLALILTGASGWQVMGYLKNVFDTTAITGAFLNSDDTDLTTNVFLTDPRLFGVRVTKNW
jgi:iron complex outermembrane recepter protein